ncbi:MAG: nucleotide pyrophosphohydrolase [Clostridia bacterium]|nr:nucleotide pyrophosphohydrolase [Clostridia bacterium]MBQ7090173.1 nucleotide pyrophosphohydrolase [Clostridia bacterium]
MNKEAFKNQEHYSYEDVLALIELLRSPDGCPWDHAQTHASVRRGVIEEAYEVAEAIDRADPAMMTEELGDLLMQVIFHASIGAQAKEFTLQDIYDRLCKKLIFRHPHLFDPDCGFAPGEDEWLALKRQEKGHASLKEELDGIAKTFPALTRAEKIAGRIHRGESPDEADSLLRLQLENFINNKNASNLGAVLFTLARASKASGIDPEAALEQENTHKTQAIH